MAAKFAVGSDQYRTIDLRILEIKRQLNQKSGSPLDPEKVADALQTIIESGAQITVKRFPKPVLVDYSISLSSMIKVGNYDGGDLDAIAAHKFFGPRGRELFDPYLVRFNRSVSTKTIISTLIQRKLRAANIAELLAFGAKYPEEQRESQIPGLNALCKSEECPDITQAALLGGGAHRRGVYLCAYVDNWEKSWSRDDSFLAVPL
ncbi:MAG TPA: hypothetical protein VMD74_00265 [Candidatus Methylomirabilis sp.]|nr:hypothetical protein [Candidatus Methylomirabilis sp.]